MKNRLFFVTALLGIVFTTVQCVAKKTEAKEKELKIILLHHSTGGVVFNGNKKQSPENPVSVPQWFSVYNNKEGVSYSIVEQAFPKKEPYGWKNYPYDYYNIWVKNAGDEPFIEEPTLEMLTKEYDVIIFKHCFPVCKILDDTEAPDINSSKKTLGNYKLQYNALKQKMAEFSDTKFIVWTGAVMTKERITEENGKRTREFFDWVKNEWDTEGDNIFVWDFYELETEGGIYLKPEHAVSGSDSHPNVDLAVKVIPLLGNRIVDVIENDGIKTNLKGELKYSYETSM